MKKYDWLKRIECYPNYFGVLVHTKFNIYDYDKKLGIKYDHWADEDGDSSIEYFKVNNVLVTIYNYSVLLVESEEDEDVDKILEYIDKVVAS